MKKNRSYGSIAILKDSKGSLTKVWLPSIVEKKLADKMNNEALLKGVAIVYLRPKGLMLSVKTNRKYYNADIIIKNVNF